MTENIFSISEIHIKYNPKISPLDRQQIKSSQDAFDQLILLLNHNNCRIKEEAVVLYLNRGNRVIGGYQLSSGGLTSTIVDIRIILAIALKSLSSGIIIGHTHPSGELIPSKNDKDFTVQLKQAAELMDIKILDHIIIGDGKYYSFSDEGLMQ